MQAQTVEAVRQAASEAGLQVIEDAYDSRLKVIELAIESLKLSLNEIEEVNSKELIVRKNIKE